MTTQYPAKPIHLLPRPDRLYQHYRRRRHQTTIANERLQTLLAGFGLESLDHGDVPRGSGRSDNLIVWTNAGKKMLKGYKESLDHDAIIHEHSILQYLAQVGFPAPRLNVTKGGETILRCGNQYYAMFDVLEGYFQYHNYLFLPRQNQHFISCAGQALGALHTTLKDFTPAGRHINGFSSRENDRWRNLAWYHRKLDACRRQTLAELADGDSGLTLGLFLSARWIEETLSRLDEELSAAALPRLIIHGDYGPYNLFFKPEQPVVILDFELARLDWRLVDLATSLPSFVKDRLGFHHRKVRQFLEAYRTACPIDRNELRLLPAVWQFLVLRRVIVCWYRYACSGTTQLLDEALQKLELAQWLSERQQKLSDVCMLGEE